MRKRVLIVAVSPCGAIGGEGHLKMTMETKSIQLVADTNEGIDNAVLVRCCGGCGDVIGAFDVVRSSPEDIGLMIKDAYRRGDCIGYQPSPVSMVMGRCSCEEADGD